MEVDRVVVAVRSFFYRLWARFLTQLGNIKLFRYPLWWVYDPDDFEVDGEVIRLVLNIVRPGDILLRGYNHYLDGHFVPDSQKYSHGGIYFGEGRVIHAVAEGVSMINAIDFMRCDRLALLRPKGGTITAVARAEKFLNDKTPYDFGFTHDVSALYCFELCGECYKELDIPRKTVSKFFGLVKRDDVYLASSFFESPDMTLLVNFNPKFGIYEFNI